MTQAPVSACLIVKNEAANLRACLESIRPHVAEIVIVDTGSTDGTQDIAREFCDFFDTFDWVDDFSAARNHAFSLASQPWLFWVDGDDIVEGAEKLPELVERHDEERGDRACAVMFPYHYAFDEHGNPVIIHRRERLVTPASAWEWQDPIHEVLHPKSTDTLIIESDALIFKHRPHGKPRDMERNLRIIRGLYEKHGTAQPRWLYYLAREYGCVGDLARSISMHKLYIERSDWDDEACLSALDISRHYSTWGDMEMSIKWAFKALTRRELWAEPYLAVGRAYYHLARRGGPGERRNWEKAIHFLKLGVSMPPTQSMLFVNPLERTHEAHRYLNVALNKLGRVAEALEVCRAALAVRPDEDMAKNAKSYENYLARSRIDAELMKLLGNERISPRQAKAIRDTLDAPEDSQAQHDAQGDPAIRLKSVGLHETSGPGKLSSAEMPLPPLAATLGTSVAPGGKETGHFDPEKLDIVVYVGEAWEPWTPETAAKKGIGGSETAVIEMTKRWAAAGHRVRVFGDLPRAIDRPIPIWDRVEYVHHPHFRDVTCDVLISSRRADAIDGHLCRARLKLVWVHDVHLGSALNHARALRTDRFLCLSQWHRGFFLQTYPFVHPSQVLVTRNGIDLKRFEQPGIKRDPHKVIYSSSPDRGLKSLLQMWPHIRLRVPDATLKVFYGFEVWEKFATAEDEEKIRELRRMLRDQQSNGVTFVGRTTQEKLAREMSSAGVWAYSQWFAETSCIGAMEAQAAGLHIVTSPIAALPETAPRAAFVAGDWLSREYQAAFVDRVVGYMMGPYEPERQQSVRDASRFSWDTVAAEWLEMFPRLIAEVDRDVMPPYRPTAEYQGAAE